MGVIYDYVCLDTKMLAYGQHQRFQNITGLFKIVADALRYNKIRFKKLVWLHDFNPSAYREGLQKSYKSHRKEMKEKYNDTDKARHEAFKANYNKLYQLIEHVGVNAQVPTNSTSNIEADDIYFNMSNFAPNSKVLGFSSDEDWGYVVDSTTHVLRYHKNILVTCEEDIVKLFGHPPATLIDIGAACSQKKDNILNLSQFGKARFEKHLLGKPKEEWEGIIEGLLSNGTYGMKINPKAEYTTWLENYHHNLLMLNPIPIDKMKRRDVEFITNAVLSKVKGTTFEEFLLDCIKLYDTVPPITISDFNLLKNGTEGS